MNSAMAPGSLQLWRHADGASTALLGRVAAALPRRSSGWGAVDDKWIEPTKLVVYLGYRTGSYNILYKYNINLTHGILGGIVGI